MAFVCDVAEDVIQGHFQRHGSAYVVVVPIGYDDEEDKSYTLLVTLDILPGVEYEFTYCIVEHDGATNSEYCYWSGADVAKFIGKEDRATILGCLASVTAHLLRAVRPRHVTMCSWDVNLPEKAKRKHFLIARVFEACGYEVHTFDEYHGQSVWCMELREHREVDKLK